MTETRPRLSLIAETVLQKAALDQGFDIELGECDGWLHFESTQTPVTLALTAHYTGGWIAALAPPAVVAELERTARHTSLALPAGTVAAFTVSDAAALQDQAIDNGAQVLPSDRWPNGTSRSRIEDDGRGALVGYSHHVTWSTFVQGALREIERQRNDFARVEFDLTRIGRSNRESTLVNV